MCSLNASYVEVGEDVDLGDTCRDSLAEIVVGKSRAAVKNEGLLDKRSDGLDALEIKLRLELVCAVGSTYSDSESVTIGKSCELYSLLGLGVCIRGCADVARAYVTDLSLNGYSLRVRVIADSSYSRSVVLKGEGGAIVHNGRKSECDSLLYVLLGQTVVKMENYGDACSLRHRQKHICKIVESRVAKQALCTTDDNGRAELLSSGENAYCHFKIYRIEKSYGIFVFLGILQYFVK